VWDVAGIAWPSGQITEIGEVSWSPYVTYF